MRLFRKSPSTVLPQRRRRTLALGAAVLLAGCGVADVDLAVAPSAGAPTALTTSPVSLRPRVAPAKAAHPALPTAGARSDLIVVKFREGSRVRVRAGRLGVDATGRSAQEQHLLLRTNLSPDKVQVEVSALNARLQAEPDLGLKRLFSRAEAELDAEKLDGEATSGEELADLNLYYHLAVRGGTPERARQLVDQLNAMDSVEIAYLQPIPAVAAADIAPTTPSFSSQQGYLNAAPAGVDARYAWTLPGGKGRSVRIIDIEQGWRLDHEDLPSPFYTSGTLSVSEHGTAVLGVLAAADNAYGMTGIAPQAGIGVAATATNTDAVATAINTAAAQLSWGEIILIEQHYPGPSTGTTCPCNCGQFEYVPVEYFQADYDAIHAATARGLVVVEAAGNGSVNLDASVYGGRFNRSVRDSAAILVGAGTASGRAPECFTNYGSRVDLQGWGDSVPSLGYGDLQMVNGSDGRQWYTSSFSGTSSASPIVAGAILALQGVRTHRGQVRLSATEVRSLLRSTGTTQASSPKQIGPLPNLRAAINIRGIGGNLVDIVGGNCLEPVGSTSEVLTCTAFSTQQFTPTAASEMRTAAGQCLEVRGSSTANGAVVEAAACTGAGNQKWSFTNAIVFGIGGKCMDVVGSSGADGTRVQSTTCTGASNEQWTFTPAQELRGLAGKCLEARGTGASGTPVVLASCTGAANQKWTQGQGGRIVGASSGLCLDVTGASTADGALFQLYPCTGGDNQRFSIYGTLRGLGGKCLDLTNSTGGPGTFTQMYDCDRSLKQNWYLFP